MKKIEKNTFEIKTQEGSIKAYVNPYTDPKNDKMKGFVNITIFDKEDKVVALYASLSIIEHNGEVFLAEPKQKAYKDAEGNFQSAPWFIAPRAIKDIVVKAIIK